MMQTEDLDKYCAKAKKAGGVNIKIIGTDTIAVAPWVRFKCFGRCPQKNPPPVATIEEVKTAVHAYSRAILIHVPLSSSSESGDEMMAAAAKLMKLEEELVNDGYDKTFAMLSGTCALCKEYRETDAVPEGFPPYIRPLMEPCGIDIIQTAEDNGFAVRLRKRKSVIRNLYCLLLVD